ncbi:hypothetical protein YC2023_056757 [Brassica napus]
MTFPGTWITRLWTKLAKRKEFSENMDYNLPVQNRNELNQTEVVFNNIHLLQQQNLKTYGDDIKAFLYLHDNVYYPSPIKLLESSCDRESFKENGGNASYHKTSSAWGALLNACRIHKNVDLAEEITEKLLSMGSIESSVYLLLSNIYADAGMWEMVNSVRRK